MKSKRTNQQRAERERERWGQESMPLSDGVSLWGRMRAAPDLVEKVHNTQGRALGEVERYLHFHGVGRH